MLTEHYRNIKHMTRRIQDIGSVNSRQVTERRKNPCDPVMNPALFFRRPEDCFHKSPAGFASKVMAKPKESSIYRHITMSLTSSPPNRSSSIRPDSTVSKTSETDAFLNPLEYVSTPRALPTSADPIRALTEQVLDLVREHRVYKDKDLAQLFDRVREANRGLQSGFVEQALHQVMKILE
jgi:hypothetical protein